MTQGMLSARQGSRAAATRTTVIAVTLILVLAAGIAGITIGVTLDSDTHLVEGTFRRLLEGSYVPSRTSGYPLYEFGSAVIWAVAGRQGVMIAALVMTIAALLLLLRPTRARGSWLGLAAWVCLALTPSVLTNASAVMETPLLLLDLALLAWLLSRPAGRSRVNLAAFVGVGLMLTTTRPDAVLVVVAVLCALVAVRVPRRFRAAVSLGGGAAAGLILVALVTRRFPFQPDYLLQEPMTRRAVRGIVGVGTVFSPPGALVLLVAGVVLLVGLVRLRGVPLSGEPAKSALDSPRFSAVWLLMAMVFYGLRFIVLSDEVEYLLPLMVILAVTVPNLAGDSFRLARVTGALALLGLASTSLVTLPLTQRTDPWQLNPQASVSPQKGGLAQDFEARGARSVRTSADYREFARESLGSLAPAVSGGSVRLLPRESWYTSISAKYASTFTGVDGVVGCSQLTSRDELPGWRLSQPAGVYADVTAFENVQLLTCATVATLTPESATITAEGATAGTSAGTVIPR